MSDLNLKCIKMPYNYFITKILVNSRKIITKFRINRYCLGFMLMNIGNLKMRLQTCGPAKIPVNWKNFRYYRNKETSMNYTSKYFEKFSEIQNSHFLKIDTLVLNIS